MSNRATNFSRMLWLYIRIKSELEDGLTIDKVSDKFEIGRDIVQLYTMANDNRQFANTLADINEIINEDGYICNWLDYNDNLFDDEESA